MFPSDHSASNARDTSSSDAFYLAFRDSMPEAYRLRYGEDAMRLHARMVQRRARSFVHVELCPEELQTEEHATWICVVTNDRPGLLSLLSAAICAHSLDVLGARIYCRSRPGQIDEAVDFFAVRHVKDVSADLVASDLIAIQKSIESLLLGNVDEAWLARRASPTSRPAAGQPTVVQFRRAGAQKVLVVETDDRPGLLLTITLALHRAQVKVVRSNVTTVAGRAHDEFEIVEVDGPPLSEGRSQEIEDAIKSALTRKK